MNCVHATHRTYTAYNTSSSMILFVFSNTYAHKFPFLRAFFADFGNINERLCGPLAIFAVFHFHGDADDRK